MYITEEVSDNGRNSFLAVLRQGCRHTVTDSLVTLTPEQKGLPTAPRARARGLALLRASTDRRLRDVPGRAYLREVEARLCDAFNTFYVVLCNLRVVTFQVVFIFFTLSWIFQYPQTWSTFIL